MKSKTLLQTISLLVALMMLFGVIGCTGDGTTTTTTTGQGGETTTTAAEEPTEPEEPTQLDIVVLNMADNWNDELVAYVNEKLNIELNLIPLDGSVAGEQRQLWATSDTLPDVIPTYTASELRFYQWLDEELIRSIPGEMVAKYPNASEVFFNFTVLQDLYDLTGEYWFLPRPESRTGMYEAKQRRIFYRKDWAANVGFPQQPATTDEFYAMLEAFRNGDPNNSGNKDTYGIAGDYWSLFYLFDAPHSYWIYEGDQWIPGYLGDNMVLGLQFIRDLIKNDIWDPEMAGMGGDGQQKWAQGTIGSFIGNGDQFWLWNIIANIFGEANPDLGDPLDVIGLLEPPAYEGVRSWEPFAMRAGQEISYHVDDAKLEKIVQLYDFMLSDEGTNLFNWGFEGIDYTINEDGTFERNPEEFGEDETLGDKYPSSGFGSFGHMNFEFAAMIEGGDTSIPVEYKLYNQQVLEKYNPHTREYRLDVTYYPAPSQAEVTFDWPGMLVDIMIGDDPVEQMFEDFKAYAYQMGIQNVIDEKTELFGTP